MGSYEDGRTGCPRQLRGSSKDTSVVGDERKQASLRYRKVFLPQEAAQVSPSCERYQDSRCILDRMRENIWGAIPKMTCNRLSVGGTQYGTILGARCRNGTSIRKAVQEICQLLFGNEILDDHLQSFFLDLQ
jgi:hypothetical protein